MAGSLDSVHLKIARAKYHAQSLETELVQYFKAEPCHVVGKPYGDSRYDFALRIDIPLPGSIPIIIGDCLQNLHSSLDYLVWELVVAGKNIPTNANQFPVCMTPERFKDVIGEKYRRLHGVHPDAVTEIESMQPYHHGENKETHPLRLLNEFSNINKHRRILLTRMNAFFSKDATIAKGEPFTPVRFPFPGPQSDTDIVVRETAGKMEVDADAIVTVGIDEGPIKGHEITYFLTMLIGCVESEIIPCFERFF